MPLFTRFPMGSSNPRETGTQATVAAQKEIARLAQLSSVHAAFEWVRLHERELQERQLELTRIPAPPFHEGERSLWVEERFLELGLEDVHRDEIGNVIGIRRGTEPDGKFLAVTAHIDTVFPPGSPIEARRDGERLLGPGISDNSCGVVAVFAMIAALNAAAINTQLPLLFVANVGEEGEGDLRGIRHIFANARWQENVEYVLVIDGAGVDSIIAEGLGSRRFEVAIYGPGGHSWSDYGIPNPIVAIARAVEFLARLPLPQQPKTTVNVGTIEGGTSINSIPQRATMRVDLRSADASELDRLEDALRHAVNDSLETARMETRGKSMLKSEIRQIGSRPAADLPLDARMMHVIRAVDTHLQNVAIIHRASTDANIPLSLGIEAIAIGGGGTGGGAHTLHEWFDPRGRDLALKRILLTTLGLSGVAE